MVGTPEAIQMTEKPFNAETDQSGGGNHPCLVAQRLRTGEVTRLYHARLGELVYTGLWEVSAHLDHLVAFIVF
jgi:hypothetical protein